MLSLTRTSVVVWGRDITVTGSAGLGHAGVSTLRLVVWAAGLLWSGARRLLWGIQWLTVEGILVVGKSRRARSDAEAPRGDVTILESSAVALVLDLSPVVVVGVGVSSVFAGLLVDGGRCSGARGRRSGNGGIWVGIVLGNRRPFNRGRPAMRPWSRMDLVKASSRWRGTKVSGRVAGGTICNHAGGARATLHAAGTWPPPGWFCVAVHAGRVRV